MRIAFSPRRHGALAAAVAVCLSGSNVSAQSAAAQFVTVAGTGAPGVTDGPATSATFMAPAGIAYDKAGNLFIADSAGQSVRVLDKNGVVQTIAGGGVLDATGLAVTGGYVDGRARSARFHDPMAVAVAPNGTVYVADTLNHCIRKISNGVVSTFAGRPDRIGSLDGPLATASFTSPRALALDPEGNLLVGDFGVGLREITPSGVVSTIPIPGGHKPYITGITTSGAAAGPPEHRFIALRDGVVETDVASGQSVFYKAGPTEPEDDNSGHVVIQSGKSIGYPFAIAAFTSTDFVYTDIFAHAIRYINYTVADPQNGDPSEDAAFSAGGFQDVPGKPARFDTPMGIAIGPGGRVAIADTGNRRIRQFEVDRRYLSSIADLGAANNDYRIVYIGNSYTFYNTSYEDSIPGQIQRQLRADAGRLGIPKIPTVYTIQLFAGYDATASYIQQYLSQGLAECVVWQFNSFHVINALNLPFNANIATVAPTWQPKLTKVMRDTGDQLGRSGTFFMTALMPYPYEISPVESSFYRTFGVMGIAPPDADEDFAGVGPAMRAAIGAARVPLLDLFPKFIRVEGSPDHEALFGTRDTHFTKAGNALVAAAIVRELERRHPWKK